ncbi:MAG: twin-arginine translocation signal domain-containing protein [Alphaproteobacteria bacterium]
MSNNVSRRTFIQGSATAGVVVSGAGAILANTEEAWALSTEVLSGDTALSILIMARTLYPHDFLGDQYYAEVVANLDEQAKSDSSLVEKLDNGVEELSKVIEADRTYNVAFKDQSSGLQLQNLKRIDGSDFFETVRGATLAGLYGNPRVAALFGWEGSSVEHGGYINRGFNDIGWLPKS